jgi:hypothetical protein
MGSGISRRKSWTASRSQKVYFQPDVSLDLAVAQPNYIRFLTPAGIQSPLVVQYNASRVPVLQISLSSDSLNEQQLYDYGLYNLRQRLAPIHGVTFLTPSGGRDRQIMPDKVARIADALDPATRTLMTEIDVPNSDGELSPGIYCTVELKVPRRTPSLIRNLSGCLLLCLLRVRRRGQGSRRESLRIL